MKKVSFIISLCLVAFSATVFAQQNESDGLKALESENYATAKEIFGALVKANPADAMKWFYWGEALYADEKFDSAKTAYQQGITTTPKDAHNYVGMGKCLLNEGKKEEAKKMFDKAVDLVSTKETEIKVLIGYANISADKFNNFEYAIDIVGKAIAVAKKNPKVYEAMGDIYERKNDGGQAMNNYDQAIALDPKSKTVLTKMGKLWLDAKNPELSLSRLKEALAIDPAFPPAHRALGDLYFQTKQYEKAKQELDEYMKFADQNFDAKVRYVKYLFKAKYYDVTVQEINKLLSSAPNSYLLYRLQGYSYAELDKSADAEATLSTYFQKVPADKILASDYVYYAKALLKTNKDSLAIVNMKKAMELDKSNSDFVKDILTIYFKQKKYEQVTKEFEAQINNGYKADVNSYFLAARSYYQQKDFVKADSMNKVITQLVPSSPSGWIGRAQANVQIDPETTQGLAKPYFEKYLELVKIDDPKNKNNIIQAYSYLGYYYYLQKDNAATKSWFEKVLTLDPENQQAKDVLAGLK